MARDHAPRERQRQHLARKLGRRASHDRILIVTEGTKTEPLYFTEIRQAYRLHTASVAVRHSELGTEPLQVVQYAQRLFEEGDARHGLQPRAFEQVFAVFDRDEHRSYRDALARAQELDGKLRNDNRQAVRFKAVASVPSFELWLLLHFEEVLAPLHRDEVMRRLKRHLPGYDKGAGGAFAATRHELDQALARAARLAARFSAETDPEPFTGVAELVGVLMALNA
jgi:hypothetical protein